VRTFHDPVSAAVATCVIKPEDTDMPTPKQPEPAESPDIEVQQSNERSPVKQEQLKRMIKQHPQREIPLVESIEPAEAPPKE
jgi:hypothetical protein